MPRSTPIQALILAVGCLTVALPPTVLAQPTAEYVVIFDATWSAQTHPLGFPPNPHFAGLIGGTHNDLVMFWEEGELASPGIKSMAETGSKTLLDAEVEAAIQLGTAGVVISGGGIGTSPGAVSESFIIDETHPLVTLVSMLAPSPDWFVGVTGLSLRENAEWVDNQVVDLVVWDAGTDSGVDYSSPNSPTSPPVPIFEKLDGPFTDSNIVGTFTFIRSTVSVAEAAVGATTLARLVPLGPNPFHGSTRFEIRVPGGTVGGLDVYDVGGRRVRTLLRRGTSDGRQVVVWDGRDDGGTRVAAGVYYLRLDAGGATQTGKIVVAR